MPLTHYTAQQWFTLIHSSKIELRISKKRRLKINDWLDSIRVLSHCNYTVFYMWLRLPWFSTPCRLLAKDTQNWTNVDNHDKQGPGALCNRGHPSETHPKTQSREIAFAHKSWLSWPIVLKFGTEYGSSAVAICIKHQTHWTIQVGVTNEISRDFSLRLLSGGFPILHSTPVLFTWWHLTGMLASAIVE